MADYSIDTTTFRKDTHVPLGKGYSMRPGGKPISIVIHTTNSPHQNTAFDSEARYLRDSTTVGAHFLVGKQGQIAQLLSPDLAAWHAGASVAGFANAHSIGIESHVSVGETWTGAQRDALTWLVRKLMAQYGIGAAQVETHRKIALPLGRKSDPESWPDPAFYAWQQALASPPPVSLPSDPFDQWGEIGRPTGETRGYAVPRAWLVNKKLGSCVQPERYSASGAYSVTEFSQGIILYFKTRNTTVVEMF